MGAIAQRILYEDNHLIAVNKYPGEIVQGDKSGDEPLSSLTARYLKETYGKPGNVFLGIPHRLDRPSSGAVLFARTEKALSRMSVMFKQREVIKIYWAVLDCMPPEAEGELRHFLVKNSEKNKSVASAREKRGAKEGRLTYRVIGATDNYFLVEINLLTGRHHQIRAQFAALGCRIKGDLKYGAPRSNRDGGIHLHARSLDFTHPVRKERIVITADPPREQLWNIFRDL